MSESQSHRDRDRQWERERYYDKPFFHFKVDPVLGDYFLWQRTFVMIFRANINDYLVYCHWPINNNETVAIIFFSLGNVLIDRIYINEASRAFQAVFSIIIDLW